MNALLATFVAGTVAVWSAEILAQSTTEQRGAAAYQNPAAQQRQDEKAKAAMKNVERTKNDPKAAKPDVRDPNTLKAAQGLSSSSTNAVEAKANVDRSKQQPRSKMPNVKDLTPQEREELKRQLQEQSKP